MTGAAEFIVSTAACVLTSAPVIDTGLDGQLTLAGAASLDCIAPERRGEIGALVIARLDAGAVSLNRQALANLIRRRAPAIKVSLAGGGEDAVLIRRPPQQAVASALCATALVPIGAGEALNTANVSAAPCTNDAPWSNAVRYDRINGVARANAPIEAGAALGRIMGVPAPLAAERGQMLTFEVRAGATTIQRTVEAMQPSTGGGVFVRDADGDVFSAPLMTEDVR